VLNLAQDASPGLDLKGQLVPQGRLEIGRSAILDNLQPTLRDWVPKRDFFQPIGGENVRPKRLMRHKGGPAAHKGDAT
jgi:hypothetical protein